MAEFLIDHDYHIHSYISPCSGDPGQTPAYIAKYAADHGITDICLTDHFWDERARSTVICMSVCDSRDLSESLPWQDPPKAVLS